MRKETLFVVLVLVGLFVISRRAAAVPGAAGFIGPDVDPANLAGSPQMGGRRGPAPTEAQKDALRARLTGSGYGWPSGDDIRFSSGPW